MLIDENQQLPLVDPWFRRLNPENNINVRQNRRRSFWSRINPCNRRVPNPLALPPPIYLRQPQTEEERKGNAEEILIQHPLSILYEKSIKGILLFFLMAMLSCAGLLGMIVGASMTSEDPTVIPVVSLQFVYYFTGIPLLSLAQTKSVIVYK